MKGSARVLVDGGLIGPKRPASGVPAHVVPHQMYVLQHLPSTILPSPEYFHYVDQSCKLNNCTLAGGTQPRREQAAAPAYAGPCAGRCSALRGLAHPDGAVATVVPSVGGSPASLVPQAPSGMAQFAPSVGFCPCARY